MTVEVASIPTKGYSEVIEIRVPVRFFWNKDGTFDGIEFGAFQTKLQEWEEAMATKCLEAIIPAIRKQGDDDERDSEEIIG